MLTLRQLLKTIPLFQDARVVAGGQGLERRVQWSQIADTPGLSEWLQPGELLLTTAFALQEPEASQRALVTALANKGVVGMVVTVGRYFDHVPEAMRSPAQALDFPIIELPWQVSLLELSKRISQKIIAQQQELLSKSLSIHQTLTQLVVEGAGLEAVAHALAHLLDRAVAIEDERLMLLAHAARGEQDEARRLSIRRLGSSPQMVRLLEEKGVLADLQRSPRSRRLGPVPELGMTLERIIAPITSGGQVLGYVWVVADARSLTQLDFVAIEHAATVAALVITKERDLRRAREQRRGDLLEDLLSPDLRLTPALRRRATAMGIAPDQRYRALTLLATTAPEESLNQAERWLLQALGEPSERLPRMRKLDELTVILAEDAVPLAEQALAALAADGVKINAGLGDVCHGLAELHCSYRQARESAAIHAGLGLDAPFLAFQDLGLFHWLYHLDDERLEENRYLNDIRALAVHDAEHKGDLLHTLEIYLDLGANASATAKALFLHRSTLLYRLERCQQLCQANLTSPSERLHLHVALKAWRLRASDNL